MKVFKSLADVGAAELPPGLHAVVHRVVKDFIEAYADYGGAYDPEYDGYTVLVELGDTDAVIEAAVGYALGEAPLEGCTLDDGVFLTAVLMNNQYGVTVLVPDADWLEPAVRAKLVAELAPEGA